MYTTTRLAELNKKLCVGCGNCMLVCPEQAITMTEEELGSLYPQIDLEKCIGCGLCEKNCIACLNKSTQRNNSIAVYAATAKNKELLQKSASGGVGAVLAEAFIQSGGVVVGCSMECGDGTLKPKHIVIDSLEALPKLQGSKYVQSDLGMVFYQIKESLQQGKKVLFTGTPCQVDALKHYLRNVDINNLFTIDIICHGVPSARLFADYLKTLRRNIKTFSFRDKSFGWGLMASYTFERNEKTRKVFLSPELSSYYSYFLQGEIYRESCYACRYTNLNRVGDITIGDYWGIEKEHPEYLHENGGDLLCSDGISEILVNTDKGKQLLKEYGNDLKMHKSECDRAIKWNRQLSAPSKHSERRYILIKEYASGGYRKIEKQWLSNNKCRLWYNRIKMFLKELEGTYGQKPRS